MRGKNLPLYALTALLLISVVAAQTELVEFDIAPQIPTENGIITISYALDSTDSIGEVSTDIAIAGMHVDAYTEDTNDERYSFSNDIDLPRDVAGLQDVEVLIALENEDPILAVYTVFIRPGTITSTENEEVLVQQPVVADGTVSITIDPEVPNVVRGEWIYWPITVTNTDDTGHVIQLGVQGVTDWATYRIDPQPVFSVNPGESRMAYLYMDIDEDSYLGLRNFLITAEYDGMYDERVVSLAVLQPVENDELPRWAFWIVIALIVLAVAIIIIALIMRNREDEDDDINTYY